MGAAGGSAAAAAAAEHVTAATPAPAVRPARQPDAAVLQSYFASAAEEFGVPQSVLLAVAYHESRWETHDGRPSTTGAFNVMGLAQLDAAPRAARPALAAAGSDLRGERRDGTRHAPDAAARTALTELPTGPGTDTVGAAAELIGATDAAVRTDMRQSVRAGAALLAAYQREAVGRLSDDPGRWYAAVARYGRSGDATGAGLFADRVFTTIRNGASRTTDDGQHVTLAATPSVAPQRAQLPSPPSAGPEPDAGSGSGPEADCPEELGCAYVPAAHQQTKDADPTAYGNYDIANRPADGNAIRYIVIHDTEGSYAGTVSAFQNPTTGASAHYVVSSAGEVTQMVRTKDVAWHAGNWQVNMNAIGIEHEGYALEGASWYSESEYESSAALVRYLAVRYGIPLDREHILGHDDVPGPLQSYVAGLHWDPGPYWDWGHYLDLLGMMPRDDARAPRAGDAITIAPPFTSDNAPVVTGCGETACPAQPVNFVYLRTGPSADAALVHDTVLHPSDTAGTTAASDWTDKAVYGQRFVVAAVQGDWTAIWYQGQQAWFFNPGGSVAVVNGHLPRFAVTPRPGLSSIPVYGRAYPAPDSYPPALKDFSEQPKQQLVPLDYTIPAGQSYLAVGPRVAGTYYYAKSVDASLPADHTLVTDTGTAYLPIRYNHRIAFVRVDDVWPARRGH